MTNLKTLAEAGPRDGALPQGIVRPNANGAEAAADLDQMESPETYIGYSRADNFASGVFAQNVAKLYDTPPGLDTDQWGLVGTWTVGAEQATLDQAPGRIIFRFHSRDLHLVLGPPPDNKTVRFRVTIDGVPPGTAHGADTDTQGDGVVTVQRLYQLAPKCPYRRLYLSNRVPGPWCSGFLVYVRLVIATMA